MSKPVLWHLRHTMLLSASLTTLAVASTAFAGAAAQQNAPGEIGTFLSIEGGLTCASGDRAGPSQGPFNLPAGELFNIRSDLELGSDRCGWSGRIGFGQHGVSIVPGWIDYWGLFVRHSEIPTDRTGANLIADITYFGVLYPNYTGPAEGESNEQRTVFDFEVGRDIGLGEEGATARVYGGVRYARFETNNNVSGTQTGPSGVWYYSINADTRAQFHGAGPRIGMEFSVPLASPITLILGGSASALFGKQESTIDAQVFSSFFGSSTSTRLAASANDWIGNVEGEAAMKLKPFGPQGGDLAIGVRAEAWLGQIRGPDGQDLDRYNWGPFIRYNISLNGS